EGWTRFQAKDYRGSVQSYERALGANPGDDVAMYLLALASLRAGDRAAAMKWLERLADANSDLVPRDQHFRDLTSRPGFAPMVARIKANAARHRRSAEAFRVREKGLLVEGIAYDPVSATFYLGSTTRRKIIEVPRGASPRDFVAPRREVDAIGGLRVDV